MRFFSVRFLTITVVCAAITTLLIDSTALRAQENLVYSDGPHFFEMLEDIPLMPGLLEVPESALVFDKPGGRIIESKAVSETMAAESVRAFYETTLPQLGWQPIENSLSPALLFVRQDEKLSLQIKREDGVTITDIMVSPYNVSP